MNNNFEEVYYSKNTLNIFTDASIKKFTNETVGCPGAIAINNGSIIDSKLDILRYTTNNNSEIMAIYNGILLAIKYKNMYDTLNLFSDSKICVFGLREWIFNWIKNISVVNDINMYTENYNPYRLFNSSNELVANQSEIMLVIQTILANNLNINIYHQRGHISTTKYSSIAKAKNCFCENNGIDNISLETIINLSTYNNMIDDMTRTNLQQFEYSYIPNMISAIYYNYSPDIEIDKYQGLINTK